jgi:2-keto-4-pentenoate hydratase/2-oxohepta-3-ene-1,7-dioic acid hydratase in catechol pathway
MKLVVFGPFKRLGALTGDGGIVDLNLAYTDYLREKGFNRPEKHADVELPSVLGEFITEGSPAIEAAEKALAFARKKPSLIMSQEGVKIWAPLPGLNNKIICAGSNFADHGAGMIAALEGRAATQKDIDQIMREVQEGKHQQWGFWKLAQCVIGPDDAMIYPSRTKYLDYEVELVAIIGKKGKNIPNTDKAMDYVFGYTGFNDWSIRYELSANNPADFILFKNYDTSASLGPCIVTKEEIPDPYNVKLELWLNGELRQSATTRLMMRKFPAWISYISRNFTLNPGDMFASGTCSGTASDTTPKPKDGPASTERFVKPGDMIEFKVEHIGSMKNRVIAES